MKLLRFFITQNSDTEYRVNHEIEVRSVLWHIMARSAWMG